MTFLREYPGETITKALVLSGLEKKLSGSGSRSHMSPTPDVRLHGCKTGGLLDLHRLTSSIDTPLWTIPVVPIRAVITRT